MRVRAAALLAGALACCPLAHAQQGMRNGEWHYWGGDAGSTRYSTLDQINASNASELEIAWRWQSLPSEGARETNFKATPLMVDGVLYTSAGVHQAAAIDPKSGATLWISGVRCQRNGAAEGSAHGSPGVDGRLVVTAHRRRQRRRSANRYRSGGVQQRSGTRPHPPVAGPETPQLRNGRQIFVSSCAICHGRSGEGVAGGPPALTSQRDAAKIRERVAKGGVQMPAMRTLLTDEQIRDVSDYVAAGLSPAPP